MAIQREQLEADVLIVGARPAGLSCALHLANLIRQHNASGVKPELSAENIYVLERGREIGAHQLYTYVPLARVVWIVLGGLAYCIGVIFYACKKITYHHVIWHLRVMTGSTCHYIAILYSIFPRA